MANLSCVGTLLCVLGVFTVVSGLNSSKIEFVQYNYNCEHCGDPSNNLLDVHGIRYGDYSLSFPGLLELNLVGTLDEDVTDTFQMDVTVTDIADGADTIIPCSDDGYGSCYFPDICDILPEANCSSADCLCQFGENDVDNSEVVVRVAFLFDNPGLFEVLANITYEDRPVACVEIIVKVVPDLFPDVQVNDSVDNFSVDENFPSLGNLSDLNDNSTGINDFDLNGNSTEFDDFDFYQGFSSNYTDYAPDNSTSSGNSNAFDDFDFDDDLDNSTSIQNSTSSDDFDFNDGLNNSTLSQNTTSSGNSTTVDDDFDLDDDLFNDNSTAVDNSTSTGNSTSSLTNTTALPPTDK